jgi:hypothetical protein
LDNDYISSTFPTVYIIGVGVDVGVDVGVEVGEDVNVDVGVGWFLCV